MTDSDQKDQVLDHLFEGARATRAMPSPDFMARLVEDADANLLRPAASRSSPSGQFNWLAGVFAASGLSGAAITGVWIGFAMPDALDTLDFSTDTTVALSTFLPSTDLGAVFDE